jgi:hypothetical protein
MPPNRRSVSGGGRCLWSVRAETRRRPGRYLVRTRIGMKRERVRVGMRVDRERFIIISDLRSDSYIS